MSGRERTPPIARKTPLFILGSGSMLPAIRAVAHWRALWQKPSIFFTSAGGNFGGNLVFGEEEADAYAGYLEDAGVPASFIHYPEAAKRTTNTLAEAKYAIRFMERVLGREPGMVALFGRAVHTRRAWATFSKQWPHVFVPFPDDEPLTVELLPRIVDEFDRLRIYGKKGDLLRQDPPPHIACEVERLRAFLGKPVPPEIADDIGALS